jgi:YidC/Oxa1 family membrane protein insertase
MFLALALSLLVIMTFSYFQEPVEEDPGTQNQTSTNSVVDSDTSPTGESTPDEASASNTVDDPNENENNDLVRTEPESTVSVESGETVPFDVPGLRGHFSTRGASLKSIKTKEYSHLDHPGNLYDLVFRKGDGLRTALNFPADLIGTTAFNRVRTSDTSLFRFKGTLENGLTVTKEYDFDEDEAYRLTMNVQLENTSEDPLQLDRLNFPDAPENLGAGLRWGPGFGQGREQKTQFDKVYFYYGKNGEMQYLAPQGVGGFTSMIPFMGNGDEDKPHKYVDGPVSWSAVSNRYFVAATVPGTNYDGVFLNKGDESDSFVAWSAHSAIDLGPRESKTFSYDLYMGPKFYNDLQEFYPGLESTLNYGWFTILTYPLLISLRWIYAVIPNYGIAIILLSIAIKFVLYPLTKKGLVSMQKMKKLQPKMKEIQDKYSDDKEKLNEKLMEFYSEHNVNPIGGCLPMILQLPIFIALYRMLEYSIELRGAPFAFWVTDLSAKDPYYILPVVMGVLMFFQQWYTMSASSGGAMGQQQQMMMYVMPVVFVFLFMSFPVGLVLYWMTNSAVTLLQYWMINRSMDLSDIDDVAIE